ncbi:MAG: HIRAN domain-containing protein [Eubacteriales bacterium]|nr:HIRAN domain-containing protein [Eubacteriales bacterium]
MGKAVYFTLTGIQYRYGSDFMKKGMKMHLIKEPDNKYDKEAIRCEMEGFGHVGYVANSIHTIIGESCSAGRLYDRFKKKAKGKVVCVTDRGVLCKFED